MKKFVKVLDLCLAMMLVLGLFAACGQKEEEKKEEKSAAAEEKKPDAKEEALKEPVIINFWSGLQEEQGPNQIVEAFNKIDPNLQVKHTRFVNDDAGNTKLDTALMAGQYVDVFMLYDAPRMVMRANNGTQLDCFLHQKSAA